ncbi:hypothetical protein [Lacunimicrobium album]
MPSNTPVAHRHSLLSCVLPLLLAALSGCCCYDPCGYNACYDPCGGGFYTSGMNYGSCVNDLPTLYGMQNGGCAPMNCAPISCAPIRTCSTVSRPPMVMRTYVPPTMSGNCFTGGCDVSGGCEDGQCSDDYFNDGVIYGTPEPTMGMPYGNYSYHERYHQNHHKVSWTQKFKAGWKKRFGKKACDCPRCREKRRHFKNGEVHALNCGCPICRGDQFAMNSSYEGEVIEGDVVYEGEMADGEMVDGQVVEGDVIYEDGDTHVVDHGHNPQTCPHCQKASGSAMNQRQMTYDGGPVEGEMMDGQVIEGDVIHDNGGMTQSYPEYGGQHFAPPVPARDNNGATLNGEIMEGSVPADANPQPTFRQRPSSDDAPAPPASNMPMPNNEDEFSQPRPIPDGNVSLKPPQQTDSEGLMLPPTWEEAQVAKPMAAPKTTATVQSLAPPQISSPTEHEWASSAKPATTSKTAVYTKPAARSTMDNRYHNFETKSTKPVSHEQPLLLPPAPEPRKLK